MDATSEAKLTLVYPVLADKIRTLADILMQERSDVLPKGCEVRVTQGLRSWAEQDALYAKGRTEAGPKVTNAAGGHSWHNFGLAVDLVPDDITKDGFQCDWNARHPAWKRMEEVGQSLGLECGAFWRTFPDAPHFQLNGRFPVGAPNDEARQIFKDGGSMALWAEMGV